MAVLPRPPPRHVRAAGEAIAIVDLDDDRASRPRPRQGGVGAITGVVAAGVVVLALVAFQQVAPGRASRISLEASVTAEPSASPVPTVAPLRPPVPALAPQPLPPALALPVGTTNARLTAIPDALLNDPPAARYRSVTQVRGLTGLFTIDAPLVLAWSEDGYWYELSTMRLTLRQLIDLASALE